MAHRRPRSSRLHARQQRPNLDWRRLYEPGATDRSLIGWWSRRDPQHLAHKDQIGITDFVPVRVKNSSEQACVAVALLGYGRERIAWRNGAELETVVRTDQGRTERNRYHDFVQLGPVA